MKENIVRAIAFVGRCAGAATVAYELAFWLNLPEAVWAAISALTVSQERLHETRSSLTGRIFGTLLGIAITISVRELSTRVIDSTALQMAVAIAIAALVAREFPTLRVAMWTCPIILLTAHPSTPILVVALRRGSEVILGAVVGWAFHWAAEILVDAAAGGAGLHRDRIQHVSQQGEAVGGSLLERDACDD